MSSSASIQNGSELNFDDRLDDIDEDSDGSRSGSDRESHDEEGSEDELMEERSSNCGSDSEHHTDEEHESQKGEDEEEKVEVIDELVNPPWASDPGLGGGEVILLNPEENQFFKVF